VHCIPGSFASTAMLDLHPSPAPPVLSRCWFFFPNRRLPRASCSDDWQPDATPTPVAHLASFTLLCASRLLAAAAAAQARGGILGQWKSGVGAPFALLRTADRSRTPIL